LEPYKIIDHEADVGFEAYGYTEEELFQNATCALFSLITDLGVIRPETERRVEVTGNGESLIVFLNELLYLWDVEGFIPKVTGIIREGVNIKAILRGEIFDEHRLTVAGAVKEVTYNKFSVRKEQEMLTATFIVDI
jgi:SHS2 domain-containing protein